jgi:hypothetical protein
MENYKERFNVFIKSKSDFELKYPLTNLLDAAIDSAKRTTIFGRKLHEIGTEFDVLCYIFQTMKQYFQILSDSHVTSLHPNLKISNVSLPLSHSDLEYLKKTISELENKCGFQPIGHDYFVRKSGLL